MLMTAVQRVHSNPEKRISELYIRRTLEYLQLTKLTRKARMHLTDIDELFRGVSN